MADREDFATAVGALIKGRSPVGHKHDRLSRDLDGAQLRLSPSGNLQLLSPSGSLIWEINSSGVATRGRVKSIGGDTDMRLIAQDNGTLQWVVSGGAAQLVVDSDGTLTRGSVPWERITGAPTPSQESLAPFYAAMAGATTATAPIAFVGSSTTRQGFYAGRLVENLAAAYSGGVGGGLISATNGAALTTAYSGAGVVGYNLGIGGSDTRDYLPTTVLDALELTQPALIIHGIGTNDLARNLSMTQYETALRAAVAAIDARVTVPHRHLFLTQQTRPGTFQHTPQDYTAVNRAVATDIGGAVLDLSPPLDALDIYGADPLGLGLGDNLHMNAKGGQILGELLSDALGVPSRAASLDSRLTYSSGPRDVTALLGLSAGRALLEIRNGDARLDFFAAQWPESGSPVLTDTGLADVAPDLPKTSVNALLVGGADVVQRVQVTYAGQVRLYSYTAGVVINGYVSWPMTRPIPAVLPGDPA